MEGNREIMAFCNGAYIESRRLEIRTAPDGCYYVTLKTLDFPKLNYPLACDPVVLKGLTQGMQQELTDAKGFVLRFLVEEECLTVDYQEDLERDPRLRFYGCFLYKDFVDLLSHLEY